MKYKITINDRTYEVEVERGVAQVADEYAAALPAEVPAAVVAAPVAAMPVAPVAAAPAAGTGSAKGEQVTAPMPGTILNVLVKAGDKVAEGQNLLVLEAMKMENEILAPVGGVVAQLAVTKGATVNTGDLLVVIG